MRSGSELERVPERAAREPAIEVDNLSVVYRFRRARPTLLSLLRSFASPKSSMQEVRALKGVSVEVAAGKVLGVIGRNGAGKSTLLRAIAGLVPPSRGRIIVRGQVTPLLTLGVGFNKKLTGRENVILGALAAGLDMAEARERYGDIADFAELGEFIDYPVQSYSSGMRARLGFAVAAHLDPEILLIDETLAVGDMAFKEKCQEMLTELCGQGRTVMIVSHGMASVLEMASDCLWLHDGEVRKRGSPREVVEEYMRFMRLSRSAGIDSDIEGN